MALQRNLPLYKGLGFYELPEDRLFCKRDFVKLPHVGLLFDKYVDTWGIDQHKGFVVQSPSSARDPSKKAKQGSKQCFYDETMNVYKEQQEALSKQLAAHHDRRAALLQASFGKTLTAKTDWRFISGLGVGHPFETGFIWHRTLSVPYLPGSSVKGLMRAWADPAKGWGSEHTWKTVKRLFGDTKDDGAGSLIVFDALPEKVPELELDIMNPHYAAYYNKDIYKKPDGSEGLTPPADYLSPVPIFFLAVAKEQPFRFAIAPHCPKAKGAGFTTKRGFVLLRQALATLGAGGKTAVGYGSMQVDREEEDRRRKEKKKRRVEEAERKKEAERAAYLAALSTQRRQIEAIRSAANEPGINVMTDKRNALLQSLANLLKAAAKWTDSGDREEAARICETVYTRLGWGNARKESERKAAIGKLRIVGGT